MIKKSDIDLYWRGPQYKQMCCATAKTSTWKSIRVEGESFEDVEERLKEVVLQEIYGEIEEDIEHLLWEIEYSPSDARERARDIQRICRGEDEH